LPPARYAEIRYFQCNSRPDGFDSRNAQRMMGKWFTINWVYFGFGNPAAGL
jgi:hypothetical protein